MVHKNRRRMTETMRLLRTNRHRHYAGAAAIVVALTGLFIAVGWVLGQRFEAVQWRIDAPTLLQQKIEQAMNDMARRGLWDARPAAIRRELIQRVPDIDHVEVARTLPGSLHVKATARQVIALWKAPDERLMLVDQHGTAFRPIVRGEGVDYPLLRVDATRLKAASDLLLVMRNIKSPWLLALSEVVADLGGWRLNLSAGQRWLIPFGDKSIQYVSRITLLLRQPRWHTGIWRIDARQENRWFIRPAKNQGVI
ncbi:MAG: hypothetical protein Q9M22_00520 [Mariprofundaceae bacterium]|nr:hypothetical protein [Mariprofundaceae bacterium]